MKTTTAYITVRLDIEYDETRFNSDREAQQHAVQEVPYSFPLDDGDIKITGTGICGIND